jgi:hypothetical protein
MTSQFDGASIDDGDRAVEILRGRALSDAERIDAELARHSRALNSDDYATALARQRVWARRNRRSTRSWPSRSTRCIRMVIAPRPSQRPTD